jgi:hypothetical protein
MNKVVATLASVLASAIAPALVFTIIMLVLGRSAFVPFLFPMFAMAFVVALAHSVVLGLPAVWLLLRTNRFVLWPILCVGFLVGLVPMAALTWPYRPSLSSSSAWSDGVQILNNGVPTTAGWLSYAGGAAYLGVLGTVGAVAFYYTFKRISSNYSFQRTQTRYAGSRR